MLLSVVCARDDCIDLNNLYEKSHPSRYNTMALLTKAIFLPLLSSPSPHFPKGLGDLQSLWPRCCALSHPGALLDSPAGHLLPSLCGNHIAYQLSQGKPMYGKDLDMRGRGRGGGGVGHSLLKVD